MKVINVVFTNRLTTPYYGLLLLDFSPMCNSSVPCKPHFLQKRHISKGFGRPLLDFEILIKSIIPYIEVNICFIYKGLIAFIRFIS